MNKTYKKIISTICVLAIIFSFTAPAYATLASPQEDATLIDSQGNVLSFAITAENNSYYTLSYWLNGQLEKKYLIPKNSSNSILVYNKDMQFDYSIEKTQYTSQINTSSTPEISLMASNTFGIQFNNSQQLNYAPYSTINMQSTSTHKQYSLIAPANAFAADVMSSIVENLLNAKLAALVAPTLASKILAAAIAYYGGQIVNDVITIALSTYYTCNEDVYRSSVRTQTSSTNFQLKNYVGYERYVTATFLLTTESDYDIVGLTPRTWRSATMYVTIWNDAIPNISCPGVAQFYG